MYLSFLRKHVMLLLLVIVSTILYLVDYLIIGNSRDIAASFLVTKLLEEMPENDVDHINGDIKRAFGYLSREWVLYMRHLKKDYPYLFSLAVRLNPMVDDPDPLVY